MVLASWTADRERLQGESEAIQRPGWPHHHHQWRRRQHRLLPTAARASTSTGVTDERGKRCQRGDTTFFGHGPAGRRVVPAFLAMGRRLCCRRGRIGVASVPAWWQRQRWPERCPNAAQWGQRDSVHNGGGQCNEDWTVCGHQSCQQGFKLEGVMCGPIHMLCDPPLKHFRVVFWGFPPPSLLFLLSALTNSFCW